MNHQQYLETSYWKTVAYRWNQDLCPCRTAGPQGYRGALNRSGVKAGHSIHSSLDLHISVENSVDRGQFLGFLVTSTHHMMPSIMLTKHKNMMMLVVCGGIVDGHGLPQWEVEYCGGGWMAGSCWVLRAIFLKRNGQRLWVCLGLRVTPLSHCALIQVVKPQGCPTFGKGCC